ncbi:MAG: transposase [bacterium]|nr:transposase [bacterium]
MPAKNSIKTYVENSYYHIYNRGVEKRLIFLDQQDYSVFLSYLKEYLLPKDEKELYQKLSDSNISYKEKDKILKLLQLNNFNQEITLIAYCLMPNHFHFFIKQKSAGTIDQFMNSLGTRYTMYFNRKYKRVGSLYQSVYKAVLIASEEQFLHLSRYIHKQALALKNQPCSYFEYIGERKTLWIHPEEVLSFFAKNNPSLSYESFVAENDSMEVLKNLTLDEN